MNRNGDSILVNGKRNGPMTNAERQRRYRDRKRGGPPKGRWAGHLSADKMTEDLAISRSMIFMGRWITKWAPEYEDQIMAKKIKVTPLYRRLRKEFVIKFNKAVTERPDGDYRLTCQMVDGAFVFEWVPDDDKEGGEL